MPSFNHGNFELTIQSEEDRKTHKSYKNDKNLKPFLHDSNPKVIKTIYESSPMEKKNIFDSKITPIKSYRLKSTKNARMLD